MSPRLDREGLLQFSVFEINQGMPVSNARIRITTREATPKVIDELITDSSGQAGSILLETPPLEYSVNSESDQKPYSEYDVNVTMDGFETVNIEGVQVLPDTEAIQPVYLNPVRNTGTPQENITVPDHTLWGVFPPKIPEEDVKELPETEGFVVLPNPVIPQFIVVHDGVPSNSSAPNYYVEFRDYIKNVASCEIYATWPETTLIANILCIISFTLNRVYTEWYRGKGYNFTITNSTAYDHAFSYGRNIYSEISRVVDDIFNTYVTKPGIRQPLFTQYCDGRMVQCPNWMTQWGSKDLGDLGYSAVDILRNFYGSDIYLMQATQVQGVPSSFPGVNLQAGSQGDAVKTIQNQLNAISNNYPAIPKIRADGEYGQETLNAVKVFQGVFGMPQSGIVDFPTWYRISDVYVAVSRLAELR